ncbi:MAG: PAS domain S-box protein [Methylocella sp.]
MDDADLQRRFDELQQAYAALTHEHEKIKHLSASPQIDLKLAIFDRIPMPVWACDREFRIVFWNEGAARLYGYSAEEAIGRDFVKLFVNPPEREKAKADCREIIDNNKPIKNMADDIDKHGNTRTLVTQCFPIYNVDGHSGLQVEISYEVQDYDRLKAELVELQAASRRKQEQIEELQRKLVEETRRRALSALETMSQAVKESHRLRQIATETAELSRDSDPKLIAKARAEIKAGRDKLLQWERQMRQRVLSDASADALEDQITEIENGVGLNV